MLMCPPRASVSKSPTLSNCSPVATGIGHFIAEFDALDIGRLLSPEEVEAGEPVSDAHRFAGRKAAVHIDQNFKIGSDRAGMGHRGER
jgi:hypothetical protein